MTDESGLCFLVEAEDGLVEVDSGAYLGWAYYLGSIVSSEPPKEQASGNTAMDRHQPGSRGKEASSDEEDGPWEPIKMTFEKKARTTEATTSSVPANEGNSSMQVEGTETPEWVDVWPLMFRHEVQVLSCSRGHDFISQASLTQSRSRPYTRFDG